MNALCDITEGILPELRAFAYFLKVDQGDLADSEGHQQSSQSKYFFPLSYPVMQTIKNIIVFYFKWINETVWPMCRMIYQFMYIHSVACWGLFEKNLLILQPAQVLMELATASTSCCMYSGHHSLDKSIKHFPLFV